MFRFNNLLIKVDKAAKKKLSDVFSDSNKTQNELLERSSDMAGSTDTSTNKPKLNSVLELLKSFANKNTKGLKNKLTQQQVVKMLRQILNSSKKVTDKSNLNNTLESLRTSAENGTAALKNELMIDQIKAAKVKQLDELVTKNYNTNNARKSEKMSQKLDSSKVKNTTLLNNDSFFDRLNTGALKSEIKHDDHQEKIETPRSLLIEAQKDDQAKNEFIKKLITLHKHLETKASHRNTTVEPSLSNDKLAFTGKDTKYAIVGAKDKETIDGKKVVVAPGDTSKDILKKGEARMLRANIVLPDATNVNTHIADVVETPGRNLQQHFYISQS